MGGNGRDAQRRGGAAPAGDAVYGLGMIGAWAYYWRTADDAGDRALGVLKGLVWPAFLVYEAFAAVDRRSHREDPA